MTSNVDTTWNGTNSANARMECVATKDLTHHPQNPRRWCKQDIERATAFVTRYSDRPLPIMANEQNQIIVGGVFVEAARKCGIESLTILRQRGLEESEARLFSIAATKLLELGTWDGNLIDAALREFEASIVDFSSAMIGFAPGELDRIVGLAGAADQADQLPALASRAVSRPGSLWLAGSHRILCGDATDLKTIDRLTGGGVISAAIVDPPFGCAIDGFVSKKGLHREFVEGSGEKTPDELLDFFRRFCRGLARVLKPGGLIYLFIDWRSLGLLQQAAHEVFGSLVQLCVWAKDRAGMGSFYRSQHELVLVFRQPGAPHRNNIELGRHGRNRSNVWSYPSAASSRRGREKDMLKHHPTPKSVEMITETILDCTARGEAVIDTFLGSGTTLIACERSGRVCNGMDLDPLYVDLAVRRWREWTGKPVVDAETGQTFDELAAIFNPEEAADV